MSTTSHQEPRFELAVFWNRKWYLLGSTLISLAIGFAYLSQANSVYEVSARVLVGRKASPLEPARPGRDDKEFVATQAEIIQSHVVLDRVVEALPSTLWNESSDDATSLISDNLSVTPLVGTRVLSVRLRHSEANAAVQMLDELLAQYGQFLGEMDHDSQLEALRMLTRSEQGLRDELDEREQQYRELHKSSPLLGRGKDAINVNAALMKELSGKIAELQSRKVDLENRLQLFARSNTGGLVDIARMDVALPNVQQVALTSVPGSRPTQTLDTSLALSNLSLIGDSGDSSMPDAARIVQELFLAQAREKQLAQVYEPIHPDLQAIREQIDNWTQRLHDLGKAALAASHRELDATVQQLARLEEMYEQELDRARAIDDYALQDEQAAAAIERLRTIHTSLLTHISEWQLIDPSGKDGSSAVEISVLEPPTLPENAIWADPKMLLVACGLVGLLGGIGLVVSMDQLGPTRHRTTAQRGLTATDLDHMEERRDVSEETADLISIGSRDLQVSK